MKIVKLFFSTVYDVIRVENRLIIELHSYLTRKSQKHEKKLKIENLFS